MRKILMLLAVLLVAMIAAVAMPNAAEARTLADSDGYVPEYYYCGAYDGKLGAYRYNYTYNPYTGYVYNVRGYIAYDSCEMRARGAGYNDWLTLIRHERRPQPGTQPLPGQSALQRCLLPDDIHTRLLKVSFLAYNIYT